MLPELAEMTYEELSRAYNAAMRAEHGAWNDLNTASPEDRPRRVTRWRRACAIVDTLAEELDRRELAQP